METFSEFAQYGAVGIAIALILKDVYCERIRNSQQSEKDAEFHNTVKKFNETMTNVLVVMEGLRTDIINRLPFYQREDLHD